MLDEPLLADRAAVMYDLLPVVESLLPMLRPVEVCWQPSDLLPKTGSPTWREEVEALRAEAERLTDEMLIVLVGNIVTEEALPSYQTALNRFVGGSDRTGVDDHAWAKWTRGWTAEEKRHGDVTRTYLYLSGRVDLRAVDVTVHHLIRNGFDTRADGDPFRGLTYAAVQEHATKTSWSQFGGVIGRAGAEQLHRITGLVAADEARHERVYVALLREALARDSVGVLSALREMLGVVVMPALRMTDGQDTNLFSHFAEIGQRLGVYTLRDYATNVRGLIATLGLETMEGLPSKAAEDRDAICALPARYEAFAERPARTPRPFPFRWIHGRRV